MRNVAVSVLRNAGEYFPAITIGLVAVDALMAGVERAGFFWLERMIKRPKCQVNSGAELAHKDYH